jgi:hypothetical protein
MSTTIKHFLLVFDHDLGHLVELQEFGGDGKRAVVAYEEKEREIGHLGGQSALEIVLIGSDSLETVKLTHANYFDGTAKVSKYLAGVR